MKYRITLSLIVILLSFTAIAQDNPEDELGSWYILSTNNKLNDKLTFNLQAQMRTYELASEMEQFKIRTSLPYAFTDKFSMALGYAYFRNDPSYLAETPEKFNEHRIVYDVFLKDSFKKLNILHRYRAEQRLFDSESGIDSQLWMRYMLKLSYPVGQKFALDVYDEIFLNVDSPVFAQNWLGAGLSYKINDVLKTRLGYQKINFETRSFDRLLLSLNINTYFFASKN